MTRTKKVGSTGRFGARYGAKLRRRVLDVENKAKEGHRCPACATRALKRQAAGLWTCKKCGTVFAGGAYFPYTEPGKAARRAIEQRIKGDLITLRDQQPEGELPSFLPNLEQEVIEASDVPEEEGDSEETPDED